MATIRCSYDKLVPLKDIKPNPKNPNIHSPEQIKRLAEILKYQGIRKPLIVSKQSGLLITGHGTLEAIKLNGWKEAPVSYQDFEDSDQEYAHMVADNSLASWAQLDLMQVNLEIPELGPDFDVSMLGLKNFSIDPPSLEDMPDEKPSKLKLFTCPHCQEEFEEKQAKVKSV